MYIFVQIKYFFCFTFFFLYNEFLLSDPFFKIAPSLSRAQNELFSAAIKGDIAKAKAALERKANINQKIICRYCKHINKTALSLAVENNQIEMVKFLTAWGKR